MTKFIRYSNINRAHFNKPIGPGIFLLACKETTLFLFGALTGSFDLSTRNKKKKIHQIIERKTIIKVDEIYKI
jgi:hypothetical protein